MQAETIKKNMFDWKQQWYAVHKTAHEQHKLHSPSDALSLQWMTMLTAPQRPKQLSIYINVLVLAKRMWCINIFKWQVEYSSLRSDKSLEFIVLLRKYFGSSWQSTLNM